MILARIVLHTSPEVVLWCGEGIIMARYFVI